MIVSVIMSIYSEKVEWIKEAIDSILNQTFSDFEFIIINDNPKRKENEVILSEYLKKDSRIRVVTNEENIGLTKSLNKGLSVSEGKYIARMDADDISHNTRFEKQVTFLEENSDCIVCGCNIKLFGQQNKSIHYPQDASEVFLFVRSPFAHPSVMIRKSVLQKNQIEYNENYRYSQDFELWLRLLPFGDFVNLQEELLYYRVNESQISSKNLSEQQKLAGQIRRKAISLFCLEKNIPYSISQEVGLSQIKGYKNIVLKNNIWSKEEEQALTIFLYYLYRSVKKERFSTFIYLFTTGDFTLFKIRNLLKIVYCLIYPNRYPILL